ncbi:hypothetical protein CC86DRAFT_403017 [Ophiobolus disseminans]|uniref:Uncharacterized protein n=1 Tax=Ophiobolus disseminans TaxID=1469910 RepID=A0A6A7A8Q0_9PLEO|nr:hypothetical protein CC86DRAFT_403017 [Ophiobolus disseminans]
MDLLDYGRDLTNTAGLTSGKHTDRPVEGQQKEATDWRFLDKVAHELAKSVGFGGGPKTGSKGGNHAFSDCILRWIQEHQWAVWMLFLGITAIPIVIIVTPLILISMGFGPTGIIAGSLAASTHSALASIAAKSAFAILTSAGMGGYGLMIVQTIAAIGATAPTCSAAAAAFLMAREECYRERDKSEEDRKA